MSSQSNEKSKNLQPDIDQVKKDLTPFFSHNPKTELRIEQSRMAICNPWGDDTIRIDFTDKIETAIAALNNLILPESFTAIYHRDKRSIEFIYSPFAPAEMLSRSFKFTYKNQSLVCSYKACSNELLLLAEIFQPFGPVSNTDYRNLLSFKRYLRLKEEPNSPWSKGDFFAASFWVEGVDYDEEKIKALSQHLNFYAYYFDRSTPRIIIHDAKQEMKVKRLTQAFGKFPDALVSRNLDEYLLGLWQSAIDAPDVYRKYLYLYQMLEYAAFYYIQSKVMCQLSRILVAPETASFPQSAAQRVLDTMTTDRMTDEAKIEAVILESVDAEILWQEFEINLSHFTSDIVFDGGFTLKGFLKPDAKKSEFISSWEKSVPTALRKIRNALVHARESRMSDVISPSAENYQRIAPWIGPLSRIAMQVTIYIGSES